jgi:soluble cytochrome b562
MAIRIPIITDLQDKGIRDAKKAFGDFKTSVANAEGGMGKFKAGSKSIFDAVGANAASFAVAGGVAFAKFAADGVKAFQDLALNAEKFATATGLAIEDASRYMEVGGDIGIPIDAIEGAIGRLNKTIGADPDKVRQLGVDLVYLKDGSLDVNETFLNTIERIKGIKDPAEKAKVAAQLLGKGWQSMSTLIEMGADDLKNSLDGVSDSKVIDQKELKKAKDFRDAMDKLKDQIDDVTLAVGEGLVPVLTDLAGLLDKVSSVQNIFKNIPGANWVADHVNMVSPLLSAYDLLSTGVTNFFGLFKDEKEVIPFFADDMRNARRDADLLKEAIKQTRTDALTPFKITLNDTWKEIRNVDQAWKDLTGTLEAEVAIDNAKVSLDDLAEAAAKAFSTGSQEDLANYRQQLLNATTDIANLAEGMDDASSRQVKILVDKGDLEGALALIGQIKAFQKTYKNVSDPYAAMAGFDLSSLAGLDFSGFRASGGPVARGGSYIVGEKGPELFTPGASGNITPNNALGGGGGITVNVNGGDPNSIVRALQQYVRQSGPVPVNTRAM